MANLQPGIALQHHQHHAEHDGDQQSQVEVASGAGVGFKDDLRQPAAAHQLADQQGHHQHPRQWQGDRQSGHGPGACPAGRFSCCCSTPSFNCT
ncbi:MAG: hypothetical protein ACKO50_14410, partial [Cyanobium sp.]